MSILIELTSFSNLFLVISTFLFLDEIHHHLHIKLLGNTDGGNRDDLRARFAVCILQPILQLSKKSL